MLGSLQACGRILNRFSSSPQEVLTWKQHNNGIIEFSLYKQNVDESMALCVGGKTELEQLLQISLFSHQGHDKNEIRIPEHIETSMTIEQFLFDTKTPTAIEIIFPNAVAYLRNKASYSDLESLKTVVYYPDSIFLATYKHQSLHIKHAQPAQFTNYLHRYYLKLQAEAYCRMNALDPSQQINPEIKEQMLKYLCERNTGPYRSRLNKIRSRKEHFQQQLMMTNRQIDEVLKRANFTLKMYKLGAVMLGTAHLVAFGYMIFWVDWLGWDIIEPLTFSVGCLYFLISLRFYRKYRIDRTPNSINEAIRNWSLRAKQIARLKELEQRKTMETRQLQQAEQDEQLLSNRLEFKTLLSQHHWAEQMQE